VARLRNLDELAGHEGFGRHANGDAGALGVIPRGNHFEPVAGNLVTGSTDENAAIRCQVLADIDRVTCKRGALKNQRGNEQSNRPDFHPAPIRLRGVAPC
jgi:hypothetical protein